VIDTVSVNQRRLNIELAQLDYATEVNLTFPGVLDARTFQDEFASKARLCVVVAVGDYDNSGRVDQFDINAVEDDQLEGTSVTATTARADWNLDGVIDVSDQIDVADVAMLLDGPFVDCPQSFTGGTPAPQVDPALPPDSFTAYLLEVASSDRLDGLPWADPDVQDKAEFFFYHDSNGAMLYDPAWVAVNPQPDGDNMYGVDLNLAQLNLSAPTSATLVFALSSASSQGKHADSLVYLDDISTECPENMCCNPTNGTQVPKYDDDICTIDTCDSETGTPVHTQACASCTECNETAGDVVIMLDTTGSMSAAAIRAGKDAIKALLDFFKTSPIRPRVSIGIFGCSDYTNPGGGSYECDDLQTLNAEFAYVDPNRPPTSDYGQSEPAPTGLYAYIECTEGPFPATCIYPNICHPGSSWIPCPGLGGTDLKAAIDVAQTVLPSPDSPNYIIIISDGIPTFPPVGLNCNGVSCYCQAGKDAAVSAKEAAEALGTTIVAVHDWYQGECGGPPLYEEPSRGRAFMRDELATASPTNEYFFEVTWEPDGSGNVVSDIECTFYDIVTKISCDDGDPGTVDCCDNGRCLFLPAGQSCPGAIMTASAPRAPSHIRLRQKPAVEHAVQQPEGPH